MGERISPTRGSRGIRMAWINNDMCIGCGICIEECPVNAIGQQDDGITEIRDAKCIRLWAMPGRMSAGSCSSRQRKILPGSCCKPSVGMGAVG